MEKLMSILLSMAMVGCSNWRVPHIIAKGQMSVHVEVHPAQRMNQTQTVTEKEKFD